MTQYNNPFTGVPVGWDDGEDGWGQPLNTTLLQYAFYHSRNVNGVVATVEDIPLSAANGSAYLVQENQRVYFASNLTWYFSVPPDGMKFRLVTDGSYYSKTSTGFVLDDEISEVAYSGDASDLTTGILNVARTPAFTGEVTKPAGSATLTLSASGVTAGSYGVTDYTYPTVTVDAKGRITSATNKTIPDASTTVKGLMSSADKTKLNSVASGAEANVNADWNSVTGDSQILNKPTLGNLSSVTATPVGLNLVQSTNPTASIVFPRINADNTVSLLNDVDMKAALNITGGGGEGSVTSVGLTVPIGFSTTNSPITSAGDIGLTFATGYSLPTNAKQTNWDTAFGWGNHASAGYAINGTGGTEVRTNTQLDSRYLQSFTETDPTVPTHVKSITSANITNWNTAYSDRNKWDGSATGLDAATGRDSLDVQLKTKVINTTSSNYEISSSDVYSLIRFTLNGSKTVNVLNNTNSVLPDNGQWNIRNVGTGDLTVVPETGVTINGAGGSLLVPSGGTVTIIKVGTNEYDLIGSSDAVSINYLNSRLGTEGNLSNAALGTLVNSVTDGTAGRVTTVGWGGWGIGTPTTLTTMTSARMSGVYYAASKIAGFPDNASNTAHSIFASRGNSLFLVEMNTAGSAKLFHGVSSGFDTAPISWRELLHSGVTTVDSNGFIKKASPITKLYADHVENNDEAEDVALQKLSTGVYQLLTERRFATEGWYIETPKDANGRIKVFVTYEENEDGILIQTFEPDYSLGCPVKAGIPVDIPNGRWIDIRMTYTDDEIAARVAAENEYVEGGE